MYLVLRGPEDVLRGIMHPDQPFS